MVKSMEVNTGVCPVTNSETVVSGVYADGLWFGPSTGWNDPRLWSLDKDDCDIVEYRIETPWTERVQ